MASSRWKRFAFFERNTLSLPSEVLEDLIPIGGSEGRGSRRSKSGMILAGAEEGGNDAVSVQVSTAALPLNSKPVDKGQSSNPDESALNNMWSGLTACFQSELLDTEDGAIHLPSQAQMLADDSNVISSGKSLDGLVLVFVASPDTDRVHCFDVTVRCNPPDTSENLEDLDGWRGYFAPFTTPQAPSETTESTEDPSMGIMALATCRANEGHRPLQLASGALPLWAGKQDRILYGTPCPRSCANAAHPLASRACRGAAQGG